MVGKGKIVTEKFIDFINREMGVDLAENIVTYKVKDENTEASNPNIASLSSEESKLIEFNLNFMNIRVELTDCEMPGKEGKMLRYNDNVEIKDVESGIKYIFTPNACWSE
ncbi:MAG: hypothetical protein ACQESN_08505 [Thermotogota bacterium]